MYHTNETCFRAIITLRHDHFPSETPKSFFFQVNFQAIAFAAEKNRHKIRARDHLDERERRAEERETVNESLRAKENNLTLDGRSWMGMEGCRLVGIILVLPGSRVWTVAPSGQDGWMDGWMDSEASSIRLNILYTFTR